MMIDVKETILKEIGEHLNEIVVDQALNLSRLVGFAESEEDCYYILESRTGTQAYHSCVGKLIYLHDIEQDDYIMIENLFRINGSVGTETIIEKVLE